MFGVRISGLSVDDDAVIFFFILLFDRVSFVVLLPGLTVVDAVNVSSLQVLVLLFFVAKFSFGNFETLLESLIRPRDAFVVLSPILTPSAVTERYPMKTIIVRTIAELTRHTNKHCITNLSKCYFNVICFKICSLMQLQLIIMYK